MHDEPRSSQTLRCFLALRPPEACRQRLADLTRSLDWAALRPLAAANLHLTVKFLGATDPGRIDPLLEALPPAISATALDAPLSLTPTAFALLPRPRRPRVMVLDHEPHAALSALVEQIEARVAPLGWPREARAFRPHLTVGRVKGKPRKVSIDPPPLPDDIAAWSAEHLLLMRSELHPDGARYEVMHELSLT